MLVNARLELDSPPGGGVTLTLHLPLTKLR
jgi:hypothetical protein